MGNDIRSMIATSSGRRPNASARRGAVLFFVALPAVLALGCGPSPLPPSATPTTVAGGPTTTSAPASGSSSSSTTSGTPVGTAAPAKAAVIVAAGDIVCQEPVTSPLDPADPKGGTCRDQATADLVSSIAPDAVLDLGDNQYETGKLDAYQGRYAKTWGRFKAVTHPAIGNHEYADQGNGYTAYFGAAAGETGQWWYSYDVGAWHVVALNANCDNVGCTADSPQGQWLAADLKAHASATCTVAYWHQARYSSGALHGDDVKVAPMWQILQDNGADLVLQGHEHNYERFAPQDANGAADAAKGLRSFVVGTGGKNHYEFGAPKPNSEVRNPDTYGVLKIDLQPTGYAWKFLPIAGQTFTDTGRADCH